MIKLKNQKLINFIKGKRVCIVGPANYLLGSSRGELIDSYDIVVRINTAHFAYPFSEMLAQDIGSKFDMLFIGAHLESQERYKATYVESMLKSSVACIAHSPFHWNTGFSVFEKCDNKLIHIWEMDMFECAKKKLGGNQPRTGFFAMLNVLSCDPKEVFVTGFTMYHGGGHMFLEYHPLVTLEPINPNHNSIREIVWLKELREEHPNLVLDAELVKQLDEYKIPENMVDWLV